MVPRHANQRVPSVGSVNSSSTNRFNWLASPPLRPGCKLHDSQWAPPQTQEDFNLVRVVTMAVASPSAHKARRKVKDGKGSDTLIRTRSEALVRAPSFPLAAFLWPARTSSTQWEVLPAILMVAGLFRWAAGLWGYSGTIHKRRDIQATSASPSIKTDW